MKSLENLSILIVFPDLEGKTKLREVLRSVLYKGQTAYERALKDLDKKLIDSSGRNYDLIFISSKLPHTEISEFLKACNALNLPKPPSILVCMPSISSKSSASVAAWYLEGVAGFISDPYTAQDLTELLSKVVEQRGKSDPIDAESKARKASKFLLTDAMSLVDEVARLAFEGKEGGYALKDLKALSKNFSGFYQQDPSGYESAIVETFEKAKVPAWTKTTTRKKAKSKIAVHPGIVVGQLMAQHGLSEDRLVGLLKLEPESIAALIRGQLEVDKDLAANLARVFGMTSREWLKMQTDFSAYQATKTDESKGS